MLLLSWIFSPAVVMTYSVGETLFSAPGLNLLLTSGFSQQLAGEAQRRGLGLEEF